MTEVSRDKILAALQGVKDLMPGMVSGLQIAGGNVLFMIEVDPEQGAKLEPLRQDAERAVANVPGVEKVTAILTAEREAAGRKKPQVIDNLAPRVKHIIAVASGKGGVGKSTVAANLAVALAQAGQKIGLLDADIYGPSQPRMMGLSGQKPGGEEGLIEPLTAHGVKVISIGFMIKEEAPLIWRGPMVQSAIVQLLRDVNWGELDILVVDMPPGTGDAQLTMAQKVPLSGAVIVSTPQDIALIDARKGLEMFRKVNVPVLGIIENMSTYICPSCGNEDHIFGHGGAREEAAKLNAPFLGEIPLHKDIRAHGDNGVPVVAAQPDGAYAKSFAEIARQIINALPVRQDKAA
jgi:ATP-binding protein involved in chromosome partitioning